MTDSQHVTSASADAEQPRLAAMEGAGGSPVRTGGADLHTHTEASDGMTRPEENVRLAKEAGLEALAITDHDTVAGIGEALAAGRRLGIEIVPGVEISTVEEGIDIHVLGYFVRVEDERFLQRLSELRAVRDRRNEMLIAKLNELGIPLTMEEVLSGLRRPLSPGETVGRPHIADALVRRGAVRDMQEAFERYIGVGGAAYVNPPRIRPGEAVRWIKEAGGAAVLAHPGIYGNDELVARLLDESPWDGIEAWHSDHSAADAERYLQLAERHGLIATAGSDFHGARQGKVFHGALGGRRVGLDTVRRLRERSGRD
ncbi:PHP domain-containing protein [Paenibacillus melissococcoides]|uniref:PHP domain-containing protein n=1 Tax=Paenibacillus melissococcoides TaxID=2912268 RepID=A0ABN8U815_9BACL|nr:MULTISPECIES: PHP domain-containing protein [Paenibacillus]MEB9897783.1 PHP domain-containing protein [Bacillus cereus]CAH8247286.1 PHP domain-containing protein [Paenibacillus melissococcoides]CAH8717259.1 PHP domain-containing protein [Paenibacillus melissococcoides]CAH8718247.1 PHP domain-containing protein [Paenibacillus melissococcoides]GIO77913.1 PHP-like protein [Paenibacillus dendritiformis]